MMKQYLEVKSAHPDDVLFFRLGDFYEMFGDDAMEVSRLLNLTLTHRGDQPMCGIPYHAAKSYLKRLLDAGRKVAICEQLSLPENSRELAKREVIQVYSPGTVVDDEFLDSHRDNFVLALDIVKQSCATAFADISSGAFYCKLFPFKDLQSSLPGLLSTWSVSEVLVPDDLYFTDSSVRSMLDQSGAGVTKLPSWDFSVKAGRKALEEQFSMEGTAAFGLSGDDVVLRPIGALLKYLRDMSHSSLPQISNLRLLTDEGYMLIDESCEKNLELVRSLQGGSAYTLLSAIDETRSAAGSRLLKEFILHPLCDKSAIEERQGWVTRLYDDIDERNRIRELLSSSADLVRITSKLEMGRSVVRDLVAIKESLGAFFSLVSTDECYLSLVKDSLSEPERLVALADTIGRAINPECTNADKALSVILPGFDEKLDELKGLHDNSSTLLAGYLEKIKTESGINLLKIGENRIIGVYLEVPKSQLDKVPEGFVRRQTLVGGERFTTAELSELEERINSAESAAAGREKEIYNSIVKEAWSLRKDLALVGRLFALLDVYQSFAHAAALHAYVKPEIMEEGELEIIDGRHPVVEQHIASSSFVRNSFSSAKARFALITGPNMAGKSTYLRQTALITLMAHIGSYVPASSARIPLTDRIFCRVGASDNLARGESTFLVEMQEAAFILRSATRRSLVIMDEIGRGTSTQDGMSIAYAVMMYLLELGPVTLFATHYHELTMIDTSQMQLLTLEVSQDKSGIVFLRRVIEGVAKSSYGLHVAKLAGIPSSVIRMASAFQKRHFADYDLGREGEQLDLFVDTSTADNSALDSILDELMDFDVSTSTPLEALVKLGKLQEEARSLKNTE